MQPTLYHLTMYFLRLGAVGFGGPIALCAQMKRELVDKLHWFSLQEYEEGFAFSQTAPGPVAFQLAMYLGFVRFGIAGATLVGVAFILPPFILVILLSILYVHYGTMGWIHSVLYGVSPGVVAIIFHAVLQLGKSMLRGWTSSLIAVGSLVLALVLRLDLSLIIIGAGLFGLLSALVPRKTVACTVPVASLLLFESKAMEILNSEVLPKLAWFFFKAGALTFGSGYVVVAFIQQGVVDEFHWLTVRQFLDGVAVGQLTPGPVVVTATFVGYLVDGFTGALVGTLAVLVPVYLITIFGAPLLAKYRSNPLLQGFMVSANAAAIGVITSVAIQMMSNAVTDWKTAAIMALSLAVLIFRNVPSSIIIAAAGAIGALVFSL